MYFKKSDVFWRCQRLIHKRKCNANYLNKKIAFWKVYTKVCNHQALTNDPSIWSLIEKSIQVGFLSVFFDPRLGSFMISRKFCTADESRPFKEKPIILGGVNETYADSYCTHAVLRKTFPTITNMAHVDEIKTNRPNYLPDHQMEEWISWPVSLDFLSLVYEKLA